MRTSKYISILLIILLLQACLPKLQLEKSAIINTRGVDLLEEGDQTKIETTIITYLFDPNAQNITSILFGKGNTIKDARDDAANQSSFILTPGQIRLELYGKEAAEKGILPYLNTLVRDARVSEKMQLAITNQTAKEVLIGQQNAIKINTAQYLQDLIMKEIKRNALPDNSLLTFSGLIEQVGDDAILPIVDVKGERPTLVGAALFDGDKYVEEISLNQAFLINMMEKRVKETPLDATIPLEDYLDMIVVEEDKEAITEEEFIYVFLSLYNGKGKLKLVNEETLHYKADIKMEVELLETSVLMDIKTKAASKKVEQGVSQFFESEYEKLFATLQEVNSDAFGLGRIYKSTRKGSKTTIKEWTELFPDTTVDFNVDVKILNYGTIE